MNKKVKKNFKFNLPKKKLSPSIVKLPFLRLVYYALIINVIVIVGVLLLNDRLPPEIPLYYGLPEGEFQLADSEELIIPSMVSLLVIMINISLATLISNTYLKKTLIIVSLIITLLSLATTLEIIFLVGSF